MRHTSPQIKPRHGTRRTPSGRSRIARLLFAGAVIMTAAGQAVAEDAVIRLSVKVVLDGQGNRPTNGDYNTDDEIRAAVAEANAALENEGLDWYLDLQEIVDLAGVSQWRTMPCSAKGQLEREAEDNPGRFAWRYDAINIYVLTLQGCGGVCSFPHGENRGNDIIVINKDRILNGGIGWLHELGHYFGLYHTFQCLNGACETNPQICRGAGGIDRRCPDSCPDGTNVMSYYSDISPYNASLSDCQIDVMETQMRTSRSEVVEGGGGSDDRFEENDSYSQARQIAYGVHGNLTCRDQDWFSFDVAGQTEVSVAISGSQGDLDLYVFDDGGNMIGRSESETSNEALAGELFGGTYYIAVNPYDQRFGDYVLDLQAGGGPGDCGSGVALPMVLGMGGLSLIGQGRGWRRRCC